MKNPALVLLLSPLAAFLAAHPAFAQSASGGGGADVVTVTATKRPERITEVPLAVTAIGGAEMRDRGAIDIRDVQYSIPGLNIQEQTPGAHRIQLRGVNAGAGTGLPVVGIYVDEVGITIDQQQREATFPLVDLARIEVLRGPQGTLYGEGSLAGTVRYITRNPSLTKSDGFFETNVYRQTQGDVGYRVNGAVGVPLIDDKLGLRISGGYDKLAGWIDYPRIGRQDANEGKRYFVRPKLLAKPTDALTLSLLLQRYEYEYDTENFASVADPKVRERSELFPGHDKSDLVNAIVQVDFGRATLTSSTGWQKRDLLFNVALAGFRIAFDNDFEQFNQELRLSSNGEGPLQYTVGAWFRDFKSNEDRRAYVNGVFTPVLFRIGDGPVDSRSSALFGDATWKLSDRIEVSGGGRWYRDERSTGSEVPAVARTSAKFDAFSPRLSARYEWSRDASSYVTLSKGFRSGGFNGNGTPFGPETLWNLEVGTKAILAGGAVFFDGAVFYTDYSDRQAQAGVEVAPGVFQALTRNVGKASGIGVEAAVSARLPMGFEATATLGWNDIESDSTNAEVQQGEPFDFVGRLTSSVSLSQRFPLAGSLTGLWRIDYQHADRYNNRVRQSLPNGTVATLQDFRSGAQDYVNVRLGVETRAWSLSFDVKNVLNEGALLFPIAPLAASGEGGHAVPRSYGVTFRMNFGS